MDSKLNFIEVASLSDIPSNGILKVTTSKGDILLAKVDDKIYAVDDMCTHEDSSLSLGCLKGELVSCTLHGSRFNVRTGQPMEEPATEPLQRYPVRVINGRIELCLEAVNGGN